MKQNIILLHGLFGGLSNWTSVINHFNDRYNIIVPQLPLFKKHNDDPLEFLLDFLKMTIAEAKLENVILIGNSLGGHLAIRYAHQHPSQVARLILTGSSGLYENNQFGSFLRRSSYEYIRERVEATFYDPAVATEELVAEVMIVTTDMDKCFSIIKVAKSTKRDNVLSRLPEINVPVLLIWGNEDQITPVDVAYQFRDHLPNARLVLMNQCGHAPMMEKPKEFNEAVDLFFQ